VARCIQSEAMATRIKICGITREGDADAVVRAGADALGLVFVATSARRVGVAAAADIARRVRGRVTRVGLFVDAPEHEIRAVLDQVELDVLQFHGAESGELCRRFGLPYVKAVPVAGPLPMAELEAEYRDACALLLDAYVAGRAGGTGQTFDWSLWPEQARLPLVLAGGLDPTNVRTAVRRLRPWAVDVSGGVEGPRKGEKDAEKIEQFIAEVRRAGCE
jgi:phosphoribosylanthranilate isomerase